MKASQLHRTTFETSRLLEYFSEKELSMQLGVSKSSWMEAAFKELIDNSLDACETAGILPEIGIGDTDDFLQVQDNGPGLPESVIEKSIDYSVRISDKNLYVSPSRGQLGNALKSIYAIPFVLNGEYGKVEIETGGKLYRIEVMLDRIRQQPKIEYSISEGSFIKIGTSVKIYKPAYEKLENGDFYNFGAYRLTTPYQLFNPHLRFSKIITGNYEKVVDRTSSDIKKWIPSNPTSSHWYGPEKLRDLIAGYVANEGNGGPVKTAKGFLTEFRGLAGVRKSKEILDSLGMQRTRLHDLVEGNDINQDTVRRLLDAMNTASQPVKPSALGRIGEDHMKKSLPHVHPDGVRYRQIEGTAEGLPYVLEVAFGIVAEEYEGLEASIIFGLNWSPCLTTPIDDFWSILGKVLVENSDSVVMALHIACPRFDFLDRGKTSLHLPVEMKKSLEKAIKIVTKTFTAQKRRTRREKGLSPEQIEELRKSHKPQQISVKAAAYTVMEEAYLKASGDGKYPANARQIMYAARPLVQGLTGKTRPWKNTAYFTQTLLPDYIEASFSQTSNWDVVYDSRGKLIEPHTNSRVDLGTLEVRKYISSWITSPNSNANEHLLFHVGTYGPTNRYQYALFIEKEGFDELLKMATIAERYDLAIMSTKGMSVIAARHLVEKLSDQNVTILVLRDFDKAGFSIVHTLRTSGRRYTFKKEPRVIDLGLRLEDAQDMNLEAEDVEYDSKVDPLNSLFNSGATKKEAKVLRSGGFPGHWKGKRIELNAMTSPQFISFLEKKLDEMGVKKVVPSQDVLAAAWKRAHRIAFLEKVLEEAKRRFDGNYLPAPGDLSGRIFEQIKGTRISWDDAIWEIVSKMDK